MDGAMIGQYRVTGVIGRGGMGAVYAGEHTLLGRPAAIKILLPELSQKQDVVMRFFNEARAATAIRHPGIIEIYDFGWTAEGAAFIVMEHLEGDTLARRSARSPLGWSAVLAIARQIAGALAAAHAKGIVHRDLKPDNVFLVPDPEVPGGERIKLLDFGIAKLAADSTTTVNVTKTGAVIGTPTYMAPEQCRGVAVDHRADLYALGCVMFELLCGRPPFVGEGSGDVLAAHIHVPVPAMSEAGAEIPPAVENLVRHLLAKAPADRVQSAEDVIRAIDALTPERFPTSSAPRPVVTMDSAPKVAPRVTTLSGSASTSMLGPGAGRRGRWRLVVFSAALAAVTVAIVVLVMRGGDVRLTSRATDPGAAVPGATGASSSAAAGEPAAASTAAAVPASSPGGSPAPSAERGRSPAGDPAAATITLEPVPAKPEPAKPELAKPEPAKPEPAKPEPAPSGAVAGSAEPTAAPAASPEPVTPPATDAERPAQPAEPTSIEVVIETSPSGAQVVLDGAVIGTTPYRGKLPRRDREVKLAVRLAGYVDRTIVARASRSITQRLKLVRAAAPQPQPRSKSSRDQSYNPF